MKLRILLAIAAVALVVSLAAQDKKDAAKSDVKKAVKAGAILHPEMAVKTGSYKEPAATIGQTPAQPWTETTIGAGVNKTPQPGKVVTRVGEIVDFSCYLQLGKHGEAHRPCGQKCVNSGQPVGLLTRDGALYMLMAEEHDPRRDGQVDLKPLAVEHMGHIVTVTGTETAHNNYRAIYVQGLSK